MTSVCKQCAKTLPLNNAVSGSAAQLLPHLHLQLPHADLTIFIFALSDNTHTQMQMMLYFCFIHSPLKLEGQQYLFTQIVAKFTDT